VTTFVVKQSEASFEARFAFPVFSFLGSGGPNLHQSMYLGLRRYGLTLGDIRVESGLPNLAGANATYWLSTYNAFIRAWLDHLEIFFLDLRRVSQEQMLEIAGTALGVLQHTVQDIKIDQYTAALTLHGIPENIEISQFTAQYIQKVPEDLEPIVGSGVAYYFGPEAERRVSSLAIDMSAAVPGALFIKASVIYDGATLQMAQSLSAARDYIIKMLAGIHLEPSWE
jgi:hypothetical protein